MCPAKTSEQFAKAFQESLVARKIDFHRFFADALLLPGDMKRANTRPDDSTYGREYVHSLAQKVFAYLNLAQHELAAANLTQFQYWLTAAS